MNGSLGVRVKSGDIHAGVLIELVNTQGYGVIFTTATKNRITLEGE